ncbi:hypothetical protein [Haladaptatus cibarius]|uniref:hypothetical protein n=1 Tax=Haladaptatus cibarius TaxID=453847 RepID=UPI000678EEFD|nr:hypothetical protein [Haladaptatus cibarius]
MIPISRDIFITVGIDRFWTIGYLSCCALGIVASAFFVSRTSSVPGGPTTPRAVLDWIVFAVAYVCLLAGIPLLLS